MLGSRLRLTDRWILLMNRGADFGLLLGCAVRTDPRKRVTGMRFILDRIFALGYLRSPGIAKLFVGIVLRAAVVSFAMEGSRNEKAGASGRL